jgi:3-hydroxymyristoyl/3-hydroxydecanoyl-(acyl carrier protein) dehydratase
MPFAVLLEVALQVCGWLAAHGGAALTSPVDLSFRNLGGKARQLVPVLPGDGTLVTTVRQTKVSASGGMILLEYTLDTRCEGVPVYQGWTSFGFFSKEALSNQVGLIDDRAKFWQPASPPNFLPYPEGPCEPNRRWRMIDRVAFLPSAGEAKLGWLEGRKDVSPDEWFFRAHFYQDPVWPGSLGLEGFLQLVSHAARVWWGPGHCALEPGSEHEWIYRGQVTPGIPEVRIIAEITGRDDSHKRVQARSWLLVGDKVLYAMTRFHLSFHERDREVR